MNRTKIVRTVMLTVAAALTGICLAWASATDSPFRTVVYKCAVNNGPSSHAEIMACVEIYVDQSLVELVDTGDIEQCGDGLYYVANPPGSPCV